MGVLCHTAAQGRYFRYTQRDKVRNSTLHGTDVKI
jgi:hypothetical protein